MLDGIRREREALYLRQTTVDRQLLSLTQSLLLLNQAYRIAADDFKISQSQAKDLETQRGEYIRIQDTLQASSISADLLQMETLLITGRRTVEKKIKKARQVKMGYNGWKRAKQLWEAEQQQLEVQARTLQEEGATLRRLVEDFITQEKHKHTEILIEVSQLSMDINDEKPTMEEEKAKRKGEEKEEREVQRLESPLL